MEHRELIQDRANSALARVLRHAVETADKPKHLIASECGVHQETLRRAMCAVRPIGLDEAVRVLEASGSYPRMSIMLALGGHEELACDWMRSDMGAFMEGLLTSLPAQLDRHLGRRIEDITPRWANGTSQLVSKILARHIDDVTHRDIGAGYAS